MTISKRPFTYLFLSIVIFAAPAFALAHGSSASFEAVEGEYLIDIGYEPEEPKAGQQVKFDFALLREGEETSVPYSYVWVRMLQNEKVIFASGIHRQEIGQTTLLSALPDAGNYTLDVSYRDNDGELAAADFPLLVASGESALVDTNALPFAGGLAVGLVLASAYVLTRRGRSMAGYD